MAQNTSFAASPVAAPGTAALQAKFKQCGGPSWASAAVLGLFSCRFGAVLAHFASELRGDRFWAPAKLAVAAATQPLRGRYPAVTRPLPSRYPAVTWPLRR